MGQAFFISDLHMGHKRILEFCPNRGGDTVEEHDQWLIDQWNSRVSKRDKVFVLGDLAFNQQGLCKLSQMKGLKAFVLGNHDKMKVAEYMRYGTVLPSLVRYKKMWLSHCPIHPQELRGFPNIHGHVHNKSVPEPRYLNVCVDALNGLPISLDMVRGHFGENMPEFTMED